MPTARAGEINLEYFTEERAQTGGRTPGPPLLLIMGFAGSAHSWGEPFVKELAQHFTVTRFSNRGTGGSDKPQDQTTVPMMAGDAIGLLDTLGIEKTHVVGISMGGMIAQEIAVSYPQRVHGLVLGCTSVGAPKHVQADSATMQSMAPDTSLPFREIVRKSWYALVSDGFVESGHDFLEGMIDGFERYPTPMDTVMKQVMAIAAFSTVGRAKDIAAPTLVIHGDADRLIPPANGDNVHAEIPGSDLRKMPGLGHMFFWEKPEESAQIITEFLSRVPAGTK